MLDGRPTDWTMNDRPYSVWMGPRLSCSLTCPDGARTFEASEGPSVKLSTICPFLPPPVVPSHWIDSCADYLHIRSLSFRPTFIFDLLSPYVLLCNQLDGLFGLASVGLTDGTSTHQRRFIARHNSLIHSPVARSLPIERAGELSARLIAATANPSAQSLIPPELAAITDLIGLLTHPSTESD